MGYSVQCPVDAEGAEQTHVTRSSVAVSTLSGMNGRSTRCLISLIHSIPNFPGRNVVFHSFVPILTSTGKLEVLLGTLRRTLPIPPDRFSSVTNLRSHKFLFNPTVTTRLNGKFVTMHGTNGLPPRAVNRSCSLRCNATDIRVRAATISGNRHMLVISSLVTANNATGTTASLVRGTNNAIINFDFIVHLRNLSNLDGLNSAPDDSLVSVPT